MADPQQTSSNQADEDRRLFHCLMIRDPTAPADFAAAFLDRLIGWLSSRNPTLHSDLVSEAAEDAILSLIRNPDAYDPLRSELEPYLRMSAQGDLRNLLRRESRHRAGRVPLEVVEQADADGKCLGREDDPSASLEIKERLEVLADSVPPTVREGLTDPETRVLELMLRGERRTDLYADAYGVADRPAAERRRIVKQVKDRLKKRLERAGRDDEYAS